LALIGFFFQLPQIPTTLFAGLIVDRYNRKRLMLLGDAIAAIATVLIGAFYLTQQLQIWHLYIVVALVGSFSQIQVLAYQASISLIVPKDQYTRAGSLGAMVHYGSSIAGPALAGLLYPLIGLAGIVGIDLVTFAIAFITLLLATIPQPTPKLESQSVPLRSRLTFGLRQVWQQPSLRALLLLVVLFTFAHDLGGALYQPMILARTGGDPQALASVSAAAGIGGVAGAVLTSIWGGPKRRLRGLLGGIIGAGLSKTVFGLGRSLTIWIPAQFCSSLNFPLLGSCRSALWMNAIASEIQGRVFAANSLVTQLASLVAVLLAGPLAERVFEPAMASGGTLTSWLSPLFGSGAGSGIAVLYTLSALGIVLVGSVGSIVDNLKKMDT
ncbi:MAG: MFS transporter, partial [Leptolyngbya sp. SIO4C5]|nr:MFS transporter [Leptolyngbya sp. SIO4C5]